MSAETTTARSGAARCEPGAGQSRFLPVRRVVVAVCCRPVLFDVLAAGLVHVGVPVGLGGGGIIKKKTDETNHIQNATKTAPERRRVPSLDERR